MRLTVAVLLLQGTVAFHHAGNSAVSNQLLWHGTTRARRKCNRRPKTAPTDKLPFSTPTTTTTTTTSLQAANPDDVVPILKFFGSSLLLVGGAVLFGMGSQVDERKRQALEKQEYKRYLQRQAAEAAKPKKVYPKGPKQIEAERKWAEAERAAREQAEKAAREQAEAEQMEAEAARRRMVELEAAAAVLEVEESKASQQSASVSPPPPAPVPAAAAVESVPVQPSYLGAIDEVCEAPPATSDVQSAFSRSAGSGTNYLDAITEVCEAPDGTTSPSEECASAISNYLDALSLSAAQPIDAGPGIANYLDNIANAGADASSASPPWAKVSQSKSPGAGTSDYENEEPDEVLPSTTPALADYLNALSSGEISPPSAPSVKSFLDEVGSGALPGSGAAIAGYLASLDAASTATRATGQGVPTYLDTVTVTSGPSIATGGSGGRSGPANYLADLSSSGPTSEAIGKTEEATTSVAQSSNNAPRATGSGVPSYLDSVASNDGPSISTGGGSGPTSYLDSIGSSVAINAKSKTEAIRNYDGSYTIQRDVTVVIGQQKE